MKLLFIAQHQLWPLTTGARIRNYYLARELSRSAEVTYVQMLRPGDADELPPSEAAFPRVVTLRRSHSYTGINLLRGLAGPWPVTMLGFESREIAAALKNLLRSEDFDAIQIESVHLAFYLDLLRAAPSQPALFSDWHNIESELMVRYGATVRNPLKKIMALRTARLLAKVEQRTLSACDATAVPSERERHSLLARTPQATVWVVPNGVDTAYYSTQENDPGTDCGGRSLVLFVGSMDYHANIEAVTWFVERVWPGIEARFPDVDFAIVGRDPDLAVRQMASDRILVTGTVADVRPYYRRALAVAVPLQVGGGTRLKILEAMSAGVPVVSTTIGAEGIEAEHERHFLLADTAEQMAAALERLLASEDQRMRLATAARKLVQEQYDWQVIGIRLLGIYATLLEKRRQAASASRSWLPGVPIEPHQ